MQVVAEEGKMSGSVILLLDEIHRLIRPNKTFLTPFEKGTIVLIGATTSNPTMRSIQPYVLEHKFSNSTHL